MIPNIEQERYGDTQQPGNLFGRRPVDFPPLVLPSTSRQMEVCLSRKPTTSRLCFLQLASDISLISDDQSLAGRGDKPLSICRESGSHLPPSETCHTPSNTPLIEM